MSLTISTSVSAITFLTNQRFVDICNTISTGFCISISYQLFATSTKHLLNYWFKLGPSKSILTSLSISIS